MCHKISVQVYFKKCLNLDKTNIAMGQIDRRGRCIVLTNDASRDNIGLRKQEQDDDQIPENPIKTATKPNDR